MKEKIFQYRYLKCSNVFLLMSELVFDKGMYIKAYINTINTITKQKGKITWNWNSTGCVKSLLNCVRLCTDIYFTSVGCFY